MVPLNDRIMVPLYVSGLPLLLAAIALAVGKLPRGLKEITILLVLSLLVSRGLSSLTTARDLRWAGQGLASRAWQTSETLHYLRGLPAREIFSNDLPAIYFHLGKNGFSLPSNTNPPQATDREAYQEALDEMRRSVFEDGSLVVILGAAPWHRVESELPPEARAGFRVLGEFKDGVVFARP
jgi:hypothetical protein